MLFVLYYAKKCFKGGATTMNKKILVFNGSPKGDKSDTIHITRAFLEGMKKSGEQGQREVLYFP